MIKSSTLIEKINGSLDHTPSKFNTEEFVRDAVFMHADREGNVDPMRLLEFFKALKSNIETIEATIEHEIRVETIQEEKEQTLTLKEEQA